MCSQEVYFYYSKSICLWFFSSFISFATFAKHQFHLNLGEAACRKKLPVNEIFACYTALIDHTGLLFVGVASNPARLKTNLKVAIIKVSKDPHPPSMLKFGILWKGG